MHKARGKIPKDVPATQTVIGNSWIYVPSGVIRYR